MTDRHDESIDDELVDLLAGLAEDGDNEEGEEGNILKTPQGSKSGSKQDETEEEEDLESLEMSQAVWSPDLVGNDQALLKELARSFSDQTESNTCDIEDMFKS